MKLYDLSFDDKNDWLKITDFENSLKIYKKLDDNFVYNLNSTLYINIDDSLLQTYTCTAYMHWTLISYQIYNTTRLAWFLLKINNIAAKDIFQLVEPGRKIKYLDRETLQTIITDINLRD